MPGPPGHLPGSPGGVGGRGGVGAPGGFGGVGAAAGYAGTGVEDSCGYGGIGGAPNLGAAGGPGGGPVTLTCQPLVRVCQPPPVSFSPASWQADGAQRTLDEAIHHAIDGIRGDWYGVVTTPWTPAYEVSISFAADGGYSARCLWSSNMCCLAFYYGTDDDTPLKHYKIDSVSLSGQVSGTIDIIFGTRASGYYQSGYGGELEKVELDATGNRLRFEFWYDHDYGPTVFDLQRVTPPR